MRWIIRIFAGLAAGYAIGVAVGLALTELLSGNRHDKLQEMVMTAAFVTGPIGAVFGVVTAIVWAVLRQRKAVGE